MDLSFDGVDSGDSSGRLEGGVCKDCGQKLHEHDRERDYSGRGPTGSYSYNYICP